eukprot:6384355-Pyramimonas_sp.AAC.1
MHSRSLFLIVPSPACSFSFCAMHAASRSLRRAGASESCSNVKGVQTFGRFEQSAAGPQLRRNQQDR